jgi:hypothetical protein
MPSVGSYIKSVLNRSNAKGDTASSAVNGDRIPDEQRQVRHWSESV